MTDRASLPRFPTLIVEQVRVVGLAVRREAAVLAAVLGVVAVLAVLDMTDSGGDLNAFPLPPILMIVLGALTPFAVWKGERPFDGAHLWTLPVERRRHGLVKVLAGGLWLLVAVAAVQLGLVALALATGGPVGETETRAVMGPGGAFSEVRWTTPAWQWATPFATALICYVIGSAFMLGAKYPLRWGTVAVAAFFGIGILGEFAGGVLSDLFNQLLSGPFGINEAAGVGLADEIEGSPPIAGSNAGMFVRWYRLPTVEGWAAAAGAWAAAGLIALWLAASRHREG